MNKAFVREPDTSEVLCPKCGAAGVSVMRMTLEAHVPPEVRRALAASAYFCSTPKCPVAYFDAFEACVLADALVRPVYPKDPSAPLCPCFVITIDDVEADVAEGTPRRIRELLAKSQTPAAHCQQLSPTGRTCIPEVQKCYFKLRGGA